MELRKHNRIRFAIQVAATALFNGYAAGYAKGRIFTGKSKLACVPVLNCYSCPGALGACPIGSLQAVQGSRHFNISFYVLGLLTLFGMLFGRIICGFLCPFGFVQDLLYKLPWKKRKVPAKIDRALRYVKYAVLVILVMLLPIVVTDKYGTGEPFFCKWLCPAGTLGGAFPLLLKNESLRDAVGVLFGWKFLVLLIILIAASLIQRPFCKYLCPLGAFYGLFHRVTLYQMKVDHDQCVSCHKCEQTCPMNVDVLTNINSAECIRCGQCKSVCPTGSISSGFFKMPEKPASNPQ